MHASRKSKWRRPSLDLSGYWALLLTLARAIAWASDPPADQDLSTIVISAARRPTLIADQPLHVEAVPAEEIEENLTVEPGNLTSLLTELPSVRLQALVPTLGGAGLQLRGMPARETLVLTDGVPLLGTEPPLSPACRPASPATASVRDRAPRNSVA